jgi:hypothetical protein
MKHQRLRRMFVFVRPKAEGKGFDPLPKTHYTSANRGEGGAESSAPPITESALSLIVETWPRLPQAIRTALLSIVQAAEK